ncbi:MAG: hypothetical protein WCP21_21600, partial [Armatimonadota bacterium]
MPTKFALALLFLTTAALADGLTLRSFQPGPPLCRALRPALVVGQVTNASATAADATLTLTLPEGVKLTKGALTVSV